MSQDYMKMSGQKIYRGRVRASLPVSGQQSQQAQQAAAAASSYSQLTSQHKPYQTLEVNLQPGIVTIYVLDFWFCDVKGNSEL